FGATRPESRGMFWDRDDLARAWTSERRVFLVTPRAPGHTVAAGFPPGTVHLLASENGRWLYSNRPPGAAGPPGGGPAGAGPAPRGLRCRDDHRPAGPDLATSVTDSLRTLFLPPPSFEGFDGGAGSRYQARREVRSFWYPTWLAQPAAL